MADEEIETEAPDGGPQPTVTGLPFVHSAKLDQIAPALVAAQKRLKNPEKNSVNPHFKNRYADLGASMDAAKDAFNAENISLIQTFAPAPYGSVGVTTLAVHKSGQYVGGTVHVPLERDNAQGVGSAATYARRYGVQAITGMVAEDDDDGNAASSGEVKNSGNAPRAPKAAPKRGIFGR